MKTNEILLGIMLAMLTLKAVGDEMNPSGAPESWPDPMFETSSAIYSFLQIDRLETGYADMQNTKVIDVQAWIGGDYSKAWFKLEGEGVQGATLDSGEAQLLYSRLIAPFWDVQAGIRRDLRSDPELDYAVIGIQGLAPYWFEVDAAAFVSEDRDITLRAELEYEILFTQRLILQPRLELNAALQDIPEQGLDAGLNSSELGLRLRYEVMREIAPYIGVSHIKKYGSAAVNARINGEPDDMTSWVLGVRMWY